MLLKVVVFGFYFLLYAEIQLLCTADRLSRVVFSHLNLEDESASENRSGRTEDPVATAQEDANAVDDVVKAYAQLLATATKVVDSEYLSNLHLISVADFKVRMRRGLRGKQQTAEDLAVIAYAQSPTFGRVSAVLNYIVRSYDGQLDFKDLLEAKLSRSPRADHPSRSTHFFPPADHEVPDCDNKFLYSFQRQANHLPLKSGPGSLWVINEFLSTSKSRKAAVELFGGGATVEIVIRPRSGYESRGRYLDPEPYRLVVRHEFDDLIYEVDEREVLFPPRTVFRIDRIDEIKKGKPRTVVKCTEVTA